MNRFANVLMLTTTVAPFLAVVGVASLEAHTSGDRLWPAILVGSSVLLGAIAALLLRFAKTTLETQRLKLRAIKCIDREVFALLLSYFLPLGLKEVGAFRGATWPFIAVLAFAVIVVYRSRIYTVNPLLSLLGYRFYEAQSDDGVSFILLSRTPIYSTRLALSVAQISDTVLVSHGTISD